MPSYGITKIRHVYNYIQSMEYRGILYGRKICTVPVIFKYIDYPSVDLFVYMVTLEENCELTVSMNSHAMSFKGF
jgi:hypothetical protein